MIDTYKVSSHGADKETMVHVHIWVLVVIRKEKDHSICHYLDEFGEYQVE